MGVVLNERREVLEEKFFHDADLQFKAQAKRNRLLGLWVAEQLGKQGEEAQAYVSQILATDLRGPGDGDVVKKVLDDLTQANIALDEATLRVKMREFLDQAIAELGSDRG